MLPHTFMFLIFNIVYMLPVAYVHFWVLPWRVEEIFNGDPSMLADMMVFYVAVLFFYLAGSALLGFGIKIKTYNGL